MCVADDELMAEAAAPAPEEAGQGEEIAPQPAAPKDGNEYSFRAFASLTLLIIMFPFQSSDPHLR